MCTKAPFEHKAPTECAFGKRFYSEIWPHVDQYPPEIAEVIRQIESMHREFHEKAYEVEKANTTEEKQEIINSVKQISVELFRLLLRLKGML
ncbi:MAG: CZB domain-containing protein [Aquificaceae bacterium]